MSVLQDMTKGIMTTKATRASKLTPVAGESSTSVEQAAAAMLPTITGIPDAPGGVFLANEGVADIARDLRKQAAFLIEVADGLDRMTGEPTVVVADPVKVAVEDKKKAEVEADARVAAAKPDDGAEDFSVRMKRLSAQAQADAFTAADDDGTAPEPVAPTATAADGWTCPDHGAANIINTKSRKGREYRMCGAEGCERFEK